MEYVTAAGERSDEIARLFEASFTAAWAEGRAMSPEEAIAYALKG